MQVEPQTPLPLVYQINDHTDTGRDGYYVRAVVRDSLTGSTIQTKNLASAGAGTGRYTSQFNAPVDGTGLGRQIDVTTTVYSDALYTTKHPSYAEVLERWYVKSSPIHYGGGGGTEVDYERVRKIVDASVAKAVGTIDKAEPVDLGVVTMLLERLHAAVASIQMPEIPTPPEPVDLAPVHQAIKEARDSVHQKIDAINIPETDLMPVLEGIQNLAESISNVHSLTERQKSDLMQAVGDSIRSLYSKTDQRNKNVRAAISEFLKEDDGVQPPAPASSGKFGHLFKP